VDFPDLLTLCLAERPAAPGTLAGAWSFAPAIVVPLGAALALYALGWRARRVDRGNVAPPWRAACFVAGWIVLAAALVSPLCRMAATLVSAHMVQHVLLVAVAPPLLLLGAPLAVLGALWKRRAPAAPPTPGPLSALLLYGAAIWLWHFPPVYSAVLQDAALHVFAYAALIVASLAFWAHVLAADAGARLNAVPMLFATLLPGRCSRSPPPRGIPCSRAARSRGASRRSRTSSWRGL
jgi:cytochrome c oxidase assembly factor CtaG